MAVDTPAKIVILGAGPIGLEAALYGRFLGYEVELFERGEVADSVLRWGHVQMFSPFRMNRSPLGMAALEAHDERFQPPSDDALLTGRQWARQYLLPLAATDLLADHIRTRTEVLGVARQGWRKQLGVGDAIRGDSELLVLTRDQRGVEQFHAADIVVDASGCFSLPNRLGPGGLPAIGEGALRDRIEYFPPDVLGAQRECYAGRRTLLVGSGYSAGTTLVALAELARQAPGTSVTWITSGGAESGPLPLIPDDALPQRNELAVAANACAAANAVEHLPAVSIERIEWRDERFVVQFSDAESPARTFDRIVANVGYRPDLGVLQELQIHLCYATEGPIKLAAALLADESGDCLQQSSGGVESLVNPEPHFYILGAKSYGRNSKFLFSAGLEQIRQLFMIIGDRRELNLYAGANRLPT